VEGEPLAGFVEVIEIVDASDIVHVLSAPLAAGMVVTGTIDWPRRFDHMQQHTGQHLLSAACNRLFENSTVGFHMGAEVSTIDLAREVPWRDVKRASDLANGAVWEDRSVAVRFVLPEEAAALRKDPTREGQLRLVEIDRFDVCPCGGTHVARSGAVGVVAVLGAERMRGGTRLTFVCGGRAVRALRTYRDAVIGSVGTLSVRPAELPAAVERVQAEAKSLQKRVREPQDAAGRIRRRPVVRRGARVQWSSRGGAGGA
jgi:alanyl-tRNA synthetase